MLPGSMDGGIRAKIAAPLHSTSVGCQTKQSANWISKYVQNEQHHAGCPNNIIPHGYSLPQPHKIEHSSKHRRYQELYLYST